MDNYLLTFFLSFLISMAVSMCIFMVFYFTRILPIERELTETRRNLKRVAKFPVRLNELTIDVRKLQRDARNSNSPNSITLTRPPDPNAEKQTIPIKKKQPTEDDEIAAIQAEIDAFDPANAIAAGVDALDHVRQLNERKLQLVESRTPNGA